tara:strand:+ start:3739 stop:4581 length:843 start_codon:yes stop_codon:yes gene_type:complete
MAKVLGKGLDALIKDYGTEEKNRYLIGQISIDKITPNKNQPRQTFDKKLMDELTNSIAEKGVLQPITVMEKNNGRYQIIAGERRYRASVQLGLQWIPAYTVKLKNKSDIMELALIENIQRVNLNAVEEAEGYAILRGKYNLTQNQIASRVAKSRSEISNKMRLLKLPPLIKDSLRNKEISYGHARALITLKKSTDIVKIYYSIMNKNLSVRATEQLINQTSSKKTKKIIIPQNLEKFKKKLLNIFGNNIQIKINQKNNGYIKINFKTIEQLKKIVSKIIK